MNRSSTSQAPSLSFFLNDEPFNPNSEESLYIIMNQPNHFEVCVRSFLADDSYRLNLSSSRLKIIEGWDGDMPDPEDRPNIQAIHHYTLTKRALGGANVLQVALLSLKKGIAPVTHRLPLSF